MGLRRCVRVSLREVQRRDQLPAIRTLPEYVLHLRPVEVVRRVLRHVMTWALALRILAALFGVYGTIFLLIAWWITS